MSERVEGLEHPAPKLKVSVNAINIETSGGYEGGFTITNAGGYELCGEIHVDSGGVVFYPSVFSGNSVEINYSLNLDSYRAGDVYTANALVTSNGGEAVLPVTIKIIPPEIRTKEGRGISSLEDFYEYAEQSPVAARQLFNQWEFADWLSVQGYAQMELYERLVKDPNKERAVDNFLTVNGIKQKSVVEAEKRFVSVKINPTQKDLVETMLCFRRLTPGYAEIRLGVASGAEWLKLGKQTVQSTDFSSGGRAEVPLIIDTSALNSIPSTRVHKAIITTDSENGCIGDISVFAVVRRPFAARLNKTRFTTDDEGFIEVTNNMGGDTMLEIASNEKIVKLGGRKYLVGSKAEIPFTVKAGFSAAFWKSHAKDAEITVQTTSGILYRQKLGLKIED